MRKVVIDSNVYVSAAIYNGAPASLFRLATKERLFNIVVSGYIQSEVGRILLKKFNLPEEEVDRFFRLAWNNCVLVVPNLKVTVCRDPDDNHILECALEAQADFIITGDKDLLVFESYQGVKIIKPADFLENELWK